MKRAELQRRRLVMVRDVPEQNSSFVLKKKKNRKVYVQVILLDQFTQHNFVAYDVLTIIL